MSGHRGSREVASLLALGSNLGKREETLLRAVERLGGCGGLRVEAVSSLYETEPEGCLSGKLFINAVCAVATSLAPLDLLALCLDIEREFGRRRDGSSRDRTIDIDLLAYGDRVIREAGLVVPHPRLRDRLFVLAPLVEIRPDFPLPPDGASIRDVLRGHSGGGWVRRVSSRGEMR